QIWWGLLNRAEREYLTRRFSVSPFEALGAYSGLWKYQGRGFTLLKSTLGRSQYGDQPAPAPHDADSKPAPLPVERFLAQQGKQYQPSTFATDVLADVIQKAKTKNIQTVLVLPPMHWVRNVDAVNDKVIA